MVVKGFTKEELKRIKHIQRKIDFKHSINIRRPISGGVHSIYIIEFKTGIPIHKSFIAVNETDVRLGMCNNIYAAAIFDSSIVSKIPVWGCEVGPYDLTFLDLYRNDVYDALGHVFAAQERQQMVCPEAGSFTAYKKVIGKDGLAYVCELLIPKDANRLSGFERKCRADKAKVIAMWELESVDSDGVVHFIKSRKRVGYSIYKHRERRHANTITFMGEKIYKKSIDFVYRVGETVKPDNGFDLDRFNSCAPGIHFFMTMMEAYTYRF